MKDSVVGVFEVHYLTDVQGRVMAGVRNLVYSVGSFNRS